MSSELDEEEVYVACQICQTHFDVDTLLETSNNEFYCGDCFKKSIKGRKSDNSGHRTEQKPKQWGRKLIPSPEMYTDNNDLAISLYNESPSVLSLSYRPLRCPKVECNKYISVCTLENHIKHEHKEIPIMLTRFDTRCGIEDFDPCNSKYKIPKCLAVLKINDERLSSSMTKIRHPQEDQYLMMAVMCARIADDPESPYGMSYDDKVIIWIASDVQTNLSYSVAVSTFKNDCK
ncbi:uncharacterized protein LOC126743823 isoform X2 [Anthonomus grandis grandis]|nr:uncharacterized protein LOC126743823 isoform X2 [Anthonomus grandis grandis]